MRKFITSGLEDLDLVFRDAKQCIFEDELVLKVQGRTNRVLPTKLFILEVEHPMIGNYLKDLLDTESNPKNIEISLKILNSSLSLGKLFLRKVKEDLSSLGTPRISILTIVKNTPETVFEVSLIESLTLPFSSDQVSCYIQYYSAEKNHFSSTYKNIFQSIKNPKYSEDNLDLSNIDDLNGIGLNLTNLTNK